MGGTVVRYVSFETENGVPTNSNTSNSNSNSSTKRGRMIACRVMPPLQSQTELVNARPAVQICVWSHTIGCDTLGEPNSSDAPSNETLQATESKPVIWGEVSNHLQAKQADDYNGMAKEEIKPHSGSLVPRLHLAGSHCKPSNLAPPRAASPKHDPAPRSQSKSSDPPPRVSSPKHASMPPSQSPKHASMPPSQSKPSNRPPRAPSPKHRPSPSSQPKSSARSHPALQQYFKMMSLGLPLGAVVSQ